VAPRGLAGESRAPALDADMNALAAPPRRMQQAAEEIQALAAPPRRLQQEAAHGMMSGSKSRECPGVGYTNWWMGTMSDNDSIMNFYDKRVRYLQDEAGDDEYAPIQGNLYSYLALRGFGDSSGLFQEKASPILYVGLSLVILVQAIAPICVLHYGFRHMHFSDNVLGFREWCSASEALHSACNVDISYGRILGLLFIVLFCVNGIYVMRKDTEETIKIIHLMEAFKVVAWSRPQRFKPPAEFWLWLGAFVNCWCLVMCALCMWPLFVMSQDVPKDVVFDALGLTFLYNLDDISGEFGFLDGMWDADQFGDIYGALAHDEEVMSIVHERRRGRCTPDNLYRVGFAIMAVGLVLIPVLFVVVEMRIVSDEGLRAEVSQLRLQVGNLARIVDDIVLKG